MSAEQTTGRVPQFMLECFREDFYASLGDVVGWVTGRGGDPLLRACVVDQTWTATIDHRRPKHPRTMNDAPQVDCEDAFPIRNRSEYAASRLNAGVVHQDVRATELLANRCL
jgi:hypothetical protein